MRTKLKIISVILTSSLLFIIISLFKTSGYAYVVTPELKWSEGFEGGRTGGSHSKGCGNQEYIKGNPGLAHSGEGVHMSEATKDPCATSIRYYPTWDGDIPLPALVMFWAKTDVPNYPGISKTEAYKIIGGDRFSPLTVKERTDGGKSYQCQSGVCNGGFRAGKSCTKNSECPNNALLMTTHIRGDGTFDIGHALMTFRSTSIKAPIDEWFLHSAYIENIGSGSSLKTWVSIYMNNKEVSRGYTYETENKPWTGAVKHWHMGWYGDRNGNSGPFKIYNDDMKIYKVSSQTEAEAVISQELGGGPLPTTPENTPTPKPTSGPTNTPTPTGVPSTQFDIGDRVETTETANVRESPGQGLIGTQPPGVQGTVTGGPGLGVGGDHWWWVIDFDSGPDGWSREDQLKKVSGATSTPKLTSTPTSELTSTPVPTLPPIPGDLDGDSDVDIFDYNILLENFGATSCGNKADINGNCKVDIFDYNILLENFGSASTPTAIPTKTPTPTPTQIPPEQGAYYINASGGNDTNDGRSPSTAWKTLSKASSANFNPGENIYFKRGETWAGNLVIEGSGTLGNYITFASYGQGSNPIFDVQGSANSGVYIRGDYVKVVDIKVTGATFGFDVSDAAANAILENVVADGNTHGIRLGRGSGHTVRNCESRNNSQNGIVFDTKNITIAGCTVTNNSERGGSWQGLYHGIYGSGGCTNATIDKNTIEGVDNGNGINFKCPSGSITRNVISVTGNAIHLEDHNEAGPSTAGTVRIEGNLVFKNERGIVLYEDANTSWNTGVKVEIIANTAYDNNRNLSPEPSGEFDLQIKTSKVTIHDNIFHAGTCSDSCFRSVSQNASSLVSDNNCFYSSAGSSSSRFLYSGSSLNFSGWKSSTGDDKNSLFADPLFSNTGSGDFRLKSASPCVGKGAL